MKIYELRPDSDAYQWLTFADEDDFAIEATLQGTRQADTWQPRLVVPLIEAGMPTAPNSDYPTLGSTPTFSRRAVDALGEMLTANGELLPLVSKSGEFFIYNITCIADALDEERSVIRRFSSTGRVMSVQRYSFRPERLIGLTIFRIPQLPRGRPLVTDSFANAVQKAGLTGFCFDRV